MYKRHIISVCATARTKWHCVGLTDKAQRTLRIFMLKVLWSSRLLVRRSPSYIGLQHYYDRLRTGNAHMHIKFWTRGIESIFKVFPFMDRRTRGEPCCNYHNFQMASQKVNEQNRYVSAENPDSVIKSKTLKCDLLRPKAGFCRVAPS